VRYWLLTTLGLAIAGASIVAVDWAIFQLIHTGTCASGGPYVSARPCPAGTGGQIAALVGGIFAGLLGGGLYAARGGRGRPSAIGAGTIMWALLFLTIAASVALGAYGPANTGDAGARTAAVVIGVIFVPMGLAPLLAVPFGRRKLERLRGLAEHGRRCPGQIVSVSDTGVTINDNPRVRMTVRADPPGEAPFTIEKTATVSRVALPRVGDRCTVLYDPADPQGKNAITFEQMAGAATASAPTPQRRAFEQAQGEDPVARLRRLAELRDQGLITQAEFDEQKRRVLSEL
jgi:hypothetical protein